MFFPSDKAGGQNVGQFVTTPFKAWIKMSGKAADHAKKHYHNFAMTKMEEFLTRYEDPSMTVIETESRRIIENNCQVVDSLLKVVMLLGK